jgi:hypothetical protein
MNYEDFFDPHEVAVFKRVKGGSMRVARSHLLTGQKKRTKEYVHTPCGTFRLAMSGNSDNPTEMREHHRLGAKVVVMGDDRMMSEFFVQHGLNGDAVAEFRKRVRAEVRGDDPPPIAGTPSRPFPPHRPPDNLIPGQMTLV